MLKGPRLKCNEEIWFSLSHSNAPPLVNGRQQSENQHRFNISSKKGEKKID